MITEFELRPTNGRKSFAGKAVVNVDFNAMSETLSSYGTKICTVSKDGKVTRFWPKDPIDWTFTTGCHIKSFMGLDKAEFLKLPLTSENI